MNNIKTESDVCAWAETIVNGKGDKYIPLGKADMFAIAEFVMTYAPSKPLPTVPEAPPSPSPEAEKPAEVPAKDETAKDETAKDDKPYDPTPVHTTTEPISGETRKVTMTRGYALHHAHFTTQQAYDKFLEWSKKHPKEGMVMDFSTGVKSANAAFAYWLMENIVVDVPANVK